jgi:hypothetical protein
LSTPTDDAASHHNAVPSDSPPARAAEDCGEGDRQWQCLPSVIRRIARWPLPGGAEEPHKVWVLDQQLALNVVQRRAFAVIEHDSPPGATGLGSLYQPGNK